MTTSAKPELASGAPNLTATGISFLHYFLNNLLFYNLFCQKKIFQVQLDCPYTNNSTVPKTGFMSHILRQTHTWFGPLQPSSWNFWSIWARVPTFLLSTGLDITSWSLVQANNPTLALEECSYISSGPPHWFFSFDLHGKTFRYGRGREKRQTLEARKDLLPIWAL